MSEIPPDDDLPTSPHHSIPSEPPAFDIEASDAPQWAKELYKSNQALSRSNEKQALLMREIATNQTLTLGEVRSLSGRVGTIERRLGIGEKRFDTLEERMEKIEERLKELEAANAALADDGK